MQKVISVRDVLVGDIVSLETGDYIPADMLYISGQSTVGEFKSDHILGISVDESSMTGEPEAVNKSPEDPFYLSNCMVMEGVGKGSLLLLGFIRSGERSKPL